MVNSVISLGESRLSSLRILYSPLALFSADWQETSMSWLLQEYAPYLLLLIRSTADISGFRRNRWRWNDYRSLNYDE